LNPHLLLIALVALTVALRADTARTAEPAVNADAYAPQLNEPANVTTIRIAQVNPPPPGTAPSAQPGQSTIPPATSTPAQSPPSAGAQPGQSTIPPATSTPGATQLPPQPGEAAAAAGQMQAAPNVVLPAPGVVPVPVLPPQQVVVPGQVVPNQVVTPPSQIIVPDGVQQPTPFTDDGEYVEELPIEEEVIRARGVRPYGGGHPGDWSWGCGGSPYRTYGDCDDWKVGCDWAVSINGMIMSRPDADLDELLDEMIDNHEGEEDLENPVLENFDHGPGGRITFTSQMPHCAGYQLQAAYEGIEAWESSIVFEIEDLEPQFYTAVITTVTETEVEATSDMGVPTTTVTTTTGPNGTTTTVTVTSNGNITETETETTTFHEYELGPIPIQPGDPFPEGFEQRSLHYRANYHSGELNFLRGGNKSTFQPYCGFRYINFDDEINDFTNQEVQPPLPFEGPDNVPPGEFLAVAWTDRQSIFDLQNNLMGFQIGLAHDSWKLNRRISLEGNINSGVYYNKIKYSNIEGIFTTQQIADDTSTIEFDESRIDFSDAVIVDAREYDEISYHAEASLTGVCRLNKCWALRGGYQCLWIANLQLAEDAYLGDANTTEDLFFHGWHFGVECRR
jgi:hypothetical protein